MNASRIEKNPLAALKGVGPRIAEKLANKGITALEDLWFYLPRHYEDRTVLSPLSGLANGMMVLTQGRIETVEKSYRGRPMLKVWISDTQGHVLMLRFFHFRQTQVQQFALGKWIRCYGTVRLGPQGYEIAHPSYSVFDDLDFSPALSTTLDPIYPAIEGIGPEQLKKIIRQSLLQLPSDPELELLPSQWLEKQNLPTLREALMLLHLPSTNEDVYTLEAGHHPAQQRLIIEELLAHHLSLKRQRIQFQQQQSNALTQQRLADALVKRLPFALTSAQHRVFDDIKADLKKTMPMLRLVHGDVGSGKTIIAALSALIAVDSGVQVALMAPTELLAEQHFNTLKAWCASLDVEVEWLAGKVKGKKRDQALHNIAIGRARIVVGTHALMQEGVTFHRLGLVIIDEQHRFGVHQRLALRDKGFKQKTIAMAPHQLVMTATPIPRTLAMSAYADLEVSVIDELPPGRTPVQTVVLNNQRKPDIIERIQNVCEQGRQIYWVCTLIEEATDESNAAQQKKLELQAAETAYQELTEALPELRIGLVHGRMKPAEKQAVMQSFKNHELEVLVATTVIEVGVDVPNASLMVIENAERLGLAQLHQLRGRVGRGAYTSACVLLYQAPLSAIAKQRLDIMRATNDGFVIAEKDLELRGPGELLGTRQTGLVSFRIADIVRDAEHLPAVHSLSERLLRADGHAVDKIIRRWIGSASRYASA